MNRIIASMLALCCLLGSTQALAVAYCALRDPVNTIYGLFPEADGYRTSVRTVGRNERSQILSTLGLKLHFNELGRHSLYIAQQANRVVGYVHARTELSEWGLAEYAWAIGTDQRVHGVKVQRARDPKLLRPEALALVRPLLLGKNKAELQAAMPAAKQQGNALALSLLSSALKTLAITAAVWPDEVALGQAQDIARELGDFQSVTQSQDLFDAQLLHVLAKAGLDESPAFDRETIKGFRVTGAGDTYLGAVVFTQIDSIEPNLKMWWALDSQGVVESVAPHQDSALPPALQALQGLAPDHVRDCSGLAELAALELSLLARHQSAVSSAR